MTEINIRFDTRNLTGLLDRTKEQIIPGHDSRYWLQFHLGFYRYAALRAKEADVLDIGCGYGYGSNLLAETASSVTGVDYHPPAIEFATSNYQAFNLKYLRHDANERLPFEDDSFDLVVSSEVLEHIGRQKELVEEVKRVGRKGGHAIIKTPCSVLDPGNTNPHHEHVFSLEEYRELMTSVFPRAEVFIWKQNVRIRQEVVEYPFPLALEKFGDPNPSDKALLVFTETVPEASEAAPGGDMRGDLLAVCPFED